MTEWSVNAYQVLLQWESVWEAMYASWRLRYSTESDGTLRLDTVNCTRRVTDAE